MNGVLADAHVAMRRMRTRAEPHLNILMYWSIVFQPLLSEVSLSLQASPASPKGAYWLYACSRAIFCWASCCVYLHVLIEVATTGSTEKGTTGNVNDSCI